MMNAQEMSVSALAERQKSGYSLEQDFYVSQEVYDQDMAVVFSQQWLLVDHVSRIPQRGDYFLFDIGKESIIILRENDLQINAFFNVCRHRGSRVCIEEQGRKNLLVCPYHAWSYNLDGSLQAAKLMGDDFDKSQYGLHPCNVHVYQGFIFVCLAENPVDFETAYGSLTPLIGFHEFERAKIAAKINYPTTANWKLVVENFSECYHCAAAHPEYCAVHPPEMLLAFGSGPGSGPAGSAEAVAGDMADWNAGVAKLGHPTGIINSGEGAGTSMRLPIGNSALTESPDGRPVSCLMGKFKEYDGGQTITVFNPVSYVIASNDFAAVFRFTPRGPMETDVEISWLVAPEAEEGKDYEVDRLVFVWDETTKQDKTITENNQAGIRSSRYRPGPYSQHENSVGAFIKWYLPLLQASAA